MMMAHLEGALRIEAYISINPSNIRRWEVYIHPGIAGSGLTWPRRPNTPRCLSPSTYLTVSHIVFHMANYHASLNTVFHALSDPTRRAVIQQLVSAPASVKELAEPFNMALPSFMKHLDVLEDCGLITSSKTGRVRTCRLRSAQLAAAEDWLGEQRRL